MPDTPAANVGWRKAQLCGQEWIRAEPNTLKNLGAAISAAGQELQQSARRAPVEGGHDER